MCGAGAEEVLVVALKETYRTTLALAVGEEVDIFLRN
jgi:hypothetical protein